MRESGYRWSPNKYHSAVRHNRAARLGVPVVVFSSLPTPVALSQTISPLFTFTGVERFPSGSGMAIGARPNCDGRRSGIYWGDHR